jgi:hypothetical protein
MQNSFSFPKKRDDMSFAHFLAAVGSANSDYFLSATGFICG